MTGRVPLQDGVSNLFSDSYEESATRFKGQLARVRERWPAARLGSHCLNSDGALAIDWIEAEALERKDKLVILTAGEHGVEAYVGTAMLQLFLREYLARLDTRDTGLLVVHTINPWGMKHRRRTNGHNVDLNRNFIWEASAGAAPERAFDQSFNPDYARLEPLLNPRGSPAGLGGSNLVFLFRLFQCMARLGTHRFRKAVLLGQYSFPQGVYYGGESLQEETRVLMDLYRRSMAGYGQIVHLDMHTGYGPRYQMSLVSSALEPRQSRALEREYSYPLVVKANPSEFYSIQGDMIDYVYTLAGNEFPRKRLYAASFEFGTLGESVSAALRSLRPLIRENQMYWFGVKDVQARQRIEREFQELFVPREERWRAKAMADARQAFQGILCAEGLV